MKFFNVALICFASVLHGGCNSKIEGYELLDEFPIPENARDVKKFNIGSVNTQQLYFIVSEQFPSSKSLHVYKNYLTKNEWLICDNKEEEWESYQDLTIGSGVFVHRLMSYWANRERDKLLMLSALYYSQKSTNSRPDNQNQRVVIWVQSTAELDLELSRLGINC